MAGRKDKNTVDYFPHYCIWGKTIFVLENKFWNDWYSIWFKILEMLWSTENHFIDCRQLSTREFLQAKMKVDIERLNNIIDTLANLNAIDKELWDRKIIWSENFIKNITDVYIRRKQICMHKLDLCKHLSIKCIHKWEWDDIYVNINTQSKVKERKEEKSINIPFTSFRDLYNRKVWDKNACERKWEKLKPEEREKIINTLPDRLHQFSDKQFQPHPETYLNQKRWNDEIKNFNPNKITLLHNKKPNNVW